MQERFGLGAKGLCENLHFTKILLWYLLGWRKQLAEQKVLNDWKFEHDLLHSII